MNDYRVFLNVGRILVVGMAVQINGRRTGSFNAGVITALHTKTKAMTKIVSG